MVAASAVPAFADQPVDKAIKDQGATTVADLCNPGGASSVGNAQINKRGHSGAGNQFHFQVKLTNGAASEIYTLKLYSVEVSVTPPVCTATELVSKTLRTNSQRKGVRNFNFNVPPSNPDLVIVLTDLDTVHALATAKFKLL